MANPTTTVERYIGGGKLYFTPYENGAYGTEIEIGEVKDFSLTISADKKEALSKDTGANVLVEEVVSAVNTSVKFSTQNVNKENTALYLLGTVSDEVFAISDELPDGTTAAVETTVPKISGGVSPQKKGKLRMVGAPLNDSAKLPVLIVYMASLTPSGDKGYILDDFNNLGFDGKAMKTASGYFDEYLMEAA